MPSTIASITSGFFSFRSRFVSVMKSPGKMAFTVIPQGAQSAAVVRFGSMASRQLLGDSLSMEPAVTRFPRLFTRT
jgi:hypothetical protein